MDKWDSRFMELAQLVASWSKDRSRKVGCVIVGPNREILSVGYNGFPRGVNDEREERHQRPAKYLYTEHSERNALFNAVRRGIQVEGATIYVPWFPCVDCARAIIQSGLTRLVAYRPDYNDPKFAEDFRVATQILLEAGVAVNFVEGESPKQKVV